MTKSPRNQTLVRLLRAATAAALLPFAALTSVARAQVPPAKSSTAPTKATGTVRGFVFDSLMMGNMAAATVFIPGGSQTAFTDSAGHFEITNVPVGRQFIAFSSAALDSLGLGTTGAYVNVRADEITEAQLSTPSFRSLWRSLCSISSIVSVDSGIVWGTIRDAASDIRLAGAATSFSWYDVSIGADKKPIFSEYVRRVNTDSTGTYYACGLPSDIAISSEAAGTRSASGTVQYSIGDRRITRIDLLVSTDMVHKLSAKSTRADSIGATRAHGTSTLTGIVRSPAGLPLPNSSITIASVDTAVRINQDGAFQFVSLPAGTHVLQVRQVGFAPATLLVDLRPGKSTTADVVMPAARLAAFNVRSTKLYGTDRAGFEDRKRLGFGYTLETNDFKNRMDTQIILRELPGLTVTRNNSADFTVTMENASRICDPTIWVDGVRNVLEVALAYAPADIRAIEVYPRQIEVPSQFSTTNACGAILFWTNRSKW